MIKDLYYTSLLFFTCFLLANYFHFENRITDHLDSYLTLTRSIQVKNRWTSYHPHTSSTESPVKCSGRGVCQRQGNVIANDRTWTCCRVSPKILSSSGKRTNATRCCAYSARRGLMTAASIIWSFWANSQITGAGRDYCYYTRPRTQSKPDYTSVSLSLPILTRSFDCQLFALVHLHGTSPQDGQAFSLFFFLIPSFARFHLRTIL